MSFPPVRQQHPSAAGASAVQCPSATVGNIPNDLSAVVRVNADNSLLIDVTVVTEIKLSASEIAFLKAFSAILSVTLSLVALAKYFRRSQPRTASNTDDGSYKHSP